MLPEQLQRLRNGLARQGRTTIEQDRLARELDEVSMILDAVVAGQADFIARDSARRLIEGVTRITSGPGTACNCCGRPL